MNVKGSVVSGAVQIQSPVPCGQGTFEQFAVLDDVFTVTGDAPVR